MIVHRATVGTHDCPMTRDDYDDEADLDEGEHPDPEDADWNLEPASVLCPYCKREISEDASRCPHCRSYISAEDAPRPAKPWWWWVALALIVLLLITWLIRW